MTPDLPELARFALALAADERRSREDVAWTLGLVLGYPALTVAALREEHGDDLGGALTADGWQCSKHDTFHLRGYRWAEPPEAPRA